MLISIKKVLPDAALHELRMMLAQADAPWVDGRVTAGYQGAAVKLNQQIDERSDTALRGQRIVLSASRDTLSSSARHCRTCCIRRCSTATARA